MVSMSAGKKKGSPLPLRARTQQHRTMKKSSGVQMWQNLLIVQCCVVFAVLLYTGMIHIHFSTVGHESLHKTTALPSDFKGSLIQTREGVVNNLLYDDELETGKDDAHHPAPARPSSIVSARARHPCEGFTRPPPPSNSSKRTGPRSCEVCYVPVEQAVGYMPHSPSESPVLENLTYYQTKSPIQRKELANGVKLVGSDFGGYHSLMLRNMSFNIQKSMVVPCGFVKGKRPGRGTGYDINYGDLLEMEECRGIVVVSAIFDNFDVLHQPRNISEISKRNVCFYMFVDEKTEAIIKKEGKIGRREKKIGLWRLVVVRNLPYEDARRTGKIPKLLSHRLFPNARYSIWIDGKLELVVDPYQIVERFLWRDKATFAISRHYARFDVFVEAEHNKAAGKYDNASIDHQIEFYKKEGLTHFSPAKHPITSDVPEGCVIIREHTLITNLFTCLWFNEVDRFTSRDQLSFCTVRDKISAQTGWRVNMFEDCERRNFVIQSHHRDLLEKRNSSTARNLPTLPRKLMFPAQSTKLGKEENHGLRSRNPKSSGAKSTH